MHDASVTQSLSLSSLFSIDRFVETLISSGTSLLLSLSLFFSLSSSSSQVNNAAFRSSSLQKTFAVPRFHAKGESNPVPRFRGVSSCQLFFQSLHRGTGRKKTGEETGPSPPLAISYPIPPRDESKATTSLAGMKILADLFGQERTGQSRAPPLSYDRVLGVSIKGILFYRRIIIACQEISLDSISLTPLVTPLFSSPRFIFIFIFITESQSLQPMKTDENRWKPA